jgi:DNA-binding GntR family transcriptional regulator
MAGKSCRKNSVEAATGFDIVSNMTKIAERRVSLTEQITDELRRRILNGELAEGMSLRQERLAAELHKGTVVSSLSPSEIEELFGIRMQLEIWLFAAAIPRMTEMDFARAEVVIEEASKTGDFENWSALNWRFHEALYSASGSTIALKLLRSVHDNAARYVNLQLAVMGDVEHELSDHHAMLAYARLRDVERGVDILRRHIARVSRNLLTSLSREAGKGLKDIA